MRHRTLVIPHRHGTVIHRAMLHTRHVAHVVTHTRHRARVGRTGALIHSLHVALLMAHALHRTHVHSAHIHSTRAHAGHAVSHTHIHHGEQRPRIERWHLRLHARLGRQRATRVARAVERLRENRV